MTGIRPAPRGEKAEGKADGGRALGDREQGQGIYLMALLMDEKGDSVTEQLKAAIEK